MRKLVWYGVLFGFMSRSIRLYEQISFAWQIPNSCDRVSFVHELSPFVWKQGPNYYEEIPNKYQQISNKDNPRINDLHSLIACQA